MVRIIINVEIKVDYYHQTNVRHLRQLLVTIRLIKVNMMILELKCIIYMTDAIKLKIKVKCGTAVSYHGIIHTTQLRVEMLEEVMILFAKMTFHLSYTKNIVYYSQEMIEEQTTKVKKVYLHYTKK